MFEAKRRHSNFASAMAMLEVIYHNTVRGVRSTHNNAIIGLFINMLQVMTMVAVFYLMLTLIGRQVRIRGDFLIYLMTGIFLYMTFIKSMGAVSGAAGPTSPMMQHAPMNTAISIISSALSALYIQLFSVVFTLGVYHLAFAPVHFDNLIGTLAMFFLAWFSGGCVGMVFLAVKPWWPSFTMVGSTLYARANMLASGKMFVANMLPSSMLVFFKWNPLFHIIDQARGYAFINYNPHYTSIRYAVIVSLVLLMIGLMGESYTRKHASISWGAKGWG